MTRCDLCDRRHAEDVDCVDPPLDAPVDLEDRLEAALQATTLHEALRSVGWSAIDTTERGRFPGTKLILDDKGEVRGNFTASETWALLRSEGLIS